MFCFWKRMVVVYSSKYLNYQNWSLCWGRAKDKWKETKFQLVSVFLCYAACYLIAIIEDIYMRWKQKKSKTGVIKEVENILGSACSAKHFREEERNGDRNVEKFRNGETRNRKWQQQKSECSCEQLHCMGSGWVTRAVLRRVVVPLLSFRPTINWRGRRKVRIRVVILNRTVFTRSLKPYFKKTENQYLEIEQWKRTDFGTRVWIDLKMDRISMKMSSIWQMEVFMDESLMDADKLLHETKGREI